MQQPLTLTGFHCWLKSKIHGVPVGFNASRRAENISAFFLADGLNPDLVIAAFFEC
jgi:hypothetical protein